eukprot:2590741-Pleurochrysis_carterae.AAC.2
MTRKWKQILGTETSAVQPVHQGHSSSICSRQNIPALLEFSWTFGLLDDVLAPLAKNGLQLVAVRVVIRLGIFFACVLATSPTLLMGFEVDGEKR